MKNRIYMSAPDVGELEESFVVAAIRSGWIAPLGPDVDAFERDLAERVGVRHGVALSSGTAALHLGLLGLGVKPGDIVVTSTMTFAATANSIAYTGATPYFVDCDPSSGNMDPRLLRQSLESLSEAGVRPAAILPVDLLGKAANYTEITRIAEEHDVPVLCDAAESLGASHKGKAAGSFGCASIFSFNGNKIMTTSGGGMLLTDDTALAERTRYLATQARQPVVHYEHVDVGFNYRMSNLLAALGRAQLSRLDQMIARRHEIRDRYRDLFAPVKGVEIFGGEDDAEDNAWLTSILVDGPTTGWTPQELSAALSAENIESRPLWKPMHLQPVFRDAPATLNGSAERLFSTGMTLPSGSGLTNDQLALVLATIARFIGVKL
ncbi:dTDP-4-amino-4,6-dideoxygalactose transaminase [Paramicrobacterium humi]|uniref:dTDP-4-amino-4,6-dideoxygalactose transaminase n=1 Tax=Paramicrobacterium humi TaxID=640635 RepID=A0A1H4NEG8_9MICO|nr:aminotransferase class I/II-fold pyridoxal phosphate-dependent enzyme [Microbacterium humi]SEB93285.1 dTDP-4-amino-4,6-dideoxygalactose transaminase [Microbacterium humi]